MINESIFNYFTVKNVIFFSVSLLLVIFAVRNPEIALMFFVSMVIACSLNPLVDRLNKRLNRSLSAIIVLGLFILGLCLFILPVIIIGFYQVASVGDQFENFINNADKYLGKYPLLGSLGISKSGLEATLVNMVSNADKYLDSALMVIKDIGSGMVYVFISIIFTYFFMADTTSVKINFLKLFPYNIRPRVEEIVDIIARKMGGYITAQFYAILSVGIVMTIGFSYLELIMQYF